MSVSKPLCSLSASSSPTSSSRLGFQTTASSEECDEAFALPSNFSLQEEETLEEETMNIATTTSVTTTVVRTMCALKNYPTKQEVEFVDRPVVGSFSFMKSPIGSFYAGTVYVEHIFK